MSTRTNTDSRPLGLGDIDRFAAEDKERDVDGYFAALATDLEASLDAALEKLPARREVPRHWQDRED